MACDASEISVIERNQSLYHMNSSVKVLAVLILVLYSLLLFRYLLIWKTICRNGFRILLSYNSVSNSLLIYPNVFVSYTTYMYLTVFRLTYLVYLFLKD